MQEAKNSAMEVRSSLYMWVLGYKTVWFKGASFQCFTERDTQSLKNRYPEACGRLAVGGLPNGLPAGLCRQAVLSAVRS